MMEAACGAPGVLVAGVDEAGRGPLAGPVVAAAVVLPDDVPPSLATAIDDSKALSAKVRAELAHGIAAACAVGVGQASVEEIDRVNILQATFLAMARAVADLPAPPAVALIDGNAVPPGLGCVGRPVVGGDRKCLSIAAASIVAKVTRDRIMADLAAAHPGYGWERNAGYPTAAHRAAIARLGVTSHHRRSFRLMSKQASITL